MALMRLKGWNASASQAHLDKLAVTASGDRRGVITSVDPAVRTATFRLATPTLPAGAEVTVRAMSGLLSPR